jgi:predicted transposase/invertase (TIGR01784 family)
MITEPIFYRLFKTSPETLFLMLGMSVDSATEMALRYQYEALEFKQTAHRTDGVFLPKEPGLPLYFVEAQFYTVPNVFAGLLAKAYTYLKQTDPGRLFYGVVLFGTRAMAPTDLAPYQPLLDAGIIRRFYLDEMPEVENAPVGLAILYLIRHTEEQAPVAARELIARTKKEITDEALRASLIELIETVIIYKMPRLSREEIQAMLQVQDIRETRVYQEAKEEGLKEGEERGIEKGIERERQRTLQEKLDAISQLAALKIPAGDIARILKLDVSFVRQELAKDQS